ncbi:hybrid sensor histidine kinase/response regulator transcription factor [Labilibacter marinus]|uniref:hybrid sensor histidine kinase/response regulator transcription factor n=1 Tax=Labilibacter marinus TaxID=1477105 RepID=UPI00082BFB29|nr:hybrid sensor histidine kinase/response regulator transcription factor [Labilibacter marinus]
MKFKPLLLITLLFVLGCLHAQQHFLFKKVSTKDGLSQSDVHAIYQDSKGFMWFGTNDGLDRYDGKNFKNFTDASTRKIKTTSHPITQIKGDINDKLYIGTLINGVTVKNEVNGVTFGITNSIYSKQLLANNTVKCIEIIEPGLVWIANTNGLSKIDRDSKYRNPKSYKYYVNPSEIGLPSFSNIQIAQDSTQNLWILISEGIYKWTYPFDEVPREVKAFDDAPKHVIATKDGLYCALRNEVCYYDFNNNTLKKINAIEATCLLKDRSGQLWAGTTKGLHVLKLHKNNIDTLTHTIIKEGKSASRISNSHILSLYEGKDGLVWVGTKFGGINIYDPKRNHFLLFNNKNNASKLPHKNISSAFQDKSNNLWMGTFDGDFICLDKENVSAFSNNYRNVKLNRSVGVINVIKPVILPNKNEILLIGTDDGIVTYPKTNINLPHIESGVNDIFQDKKGVIWIATSQEGVYRHDPYDKVKDWQVSFDSSSPLINHATCFCYDSFNRFWVGTKGGLMLFEKDQMHNEVPEFRQITYHDDSGLNYNDIVSIYETSKKQMYFGTNGRGINVLTKLTEGSARFSYITKQDGLSNNVIKFISEDKNGSIWISTNKGINQIDSQNNRINSFNLEDGLQDMEFNSKACLLLNDGRFLMGGINGFNVFKPEAIKHSVNVPNVVLNDLSILNRTINNKREVNGRVLLCKSIDYQDSLVLKHDENSFSIKYALISSSTSLNQMARYRLVGFDEDWNYSNTNVVKYTNIPRGNYKLEISATNDGYNWSDKPKVIHLEIKPHLAFSAPMIIIYIIILMVVIYFFTKYSFIQINHKNQLQIEAFKVGQMEQLNDLKLKFFTNISHEFRTPLSLIISPIENLLARDQLTDKAVTQRVLSLVYRNATMLNKLVNQLLDFRSLEKGKLKLRVNEGNVVAFLKHIYDSFLPTARGKQINLKFSSVLKEEMAYFDHDKLEKVIYNLISNSFKNTRPNDSIELIVMESEGEEFIKILVSDTGAGIPEHIQPHVFERFFNENGSVNNGYDSSGIGLSYSKSLIEHMHGSIKFTTKENVGTTFTILIPWKKTFFKKDELYVDYESIDIKPVIDVVNKVESKDFKGDVAQVNKEYTLLVVEDNDELRLFLKGIFEQEYHIILAKNGKEGLELANEKIPDLVLSDIMMPYMNGIELAKSIRNTFEISHLPIILLTAKSSVENQLESYGVGIEGYVSKPFNVSLLKTQVGAILAGRQKLREKIINKVDISPSEVMPTNVDEKFLVNVMKIIEDRIGDPDFTVTEIAAKCGVSQPSLSKKITALTGLKPKLFLRNIRIKRAAQLLRLNELNISQITYEVGFIDLKHFRSCFKEEYGVSPSEYKRRYKEEDILT